MDVDIGRAIVAIVERDRRSRPRRTLPVEIAAYGSQAVIVVSPVRSLKRLPGVQLVPIGNGRALISLPVDHSLSQLELDVGDALGKGELSTPERQILEEIRNILQQARSSPRQSAEQRSIIVLRSGSPNGSAGARRRNRKGR
jgi:hypothetical protein